MIDNIAISVVIHILYLAVIDRYDCHGFGIEAFLVVMISLILIGLEHFRRKK